MGEESSGTIAALPTDSEVLNNEDYKKRNFAVGQRVVVVCSYIVNVVSSLS